MQCIIEPDVKTKETCLSFHIYFWYSKLFFYIWDILKRYCVNNKVQSPNKFPIQISCWPHSAASTDPNLCPRPLTCPVSYQAPITWLNNLGLTLHHWSIHLTSEDTNLWVSTVHLNWCMHLLFKVCWLVNKPLMDQYKREAFLSTSVRSQDTWES